MTMRKVFLLTTCVAGSLSWLSTAAWATSEDTCYTSGSGASASYSGCGTNPTVSGATQTQGEVTRTTTTTVTTTIASHVSGILGGSGRSSRTAGMMETGVSAGDGSINQALWVSMGATTLSSTVSGAAYSGTMSNQTAGYDVMVNERTVVGVSVFRQGDTFQTDFNAGNLRGDSWWLVPYAGYDFGQGSTVDAMVGVAYASGKASRAAGNAEGHYDGYRTMLAVNGHHNWGLGNDLFLRGDVGVSGAYSRTNGYDETGTAARHVDASTSHLLQGKAGARLSYAWDRVEPYVSAYYAYDFVGDYVGDSGIAPGGSKDADEFQFYLGLDWYATDTESVGLEINRVVGRDRSEAMGLMMNGRLRF